jgi:SAM-dependent methyltransferase
MSGSSAPLTGWARKAADLYEPSYARRYRTHDDTRGSAYLMFCAWLHDVCLSFEKPIDVLDLGCGTGRYFSCVANVRALVGLDASAAMLEEARRPVEADGITAAAVELVQGDIMSHDFGADRFDLVYSIGVLAEHTPLDEQVTANVHRWLKPGGRFAFTTVHPDSPSVPKTLPRSIGRLLFPLTAGGLRRRLHDRLTAHGLYADELRVHRLLEPGFTIESLTRVTSEAHLHALCVARKAGS